MRTADEVLEFWFGAPARNGDELMAKVGRWFMGGEALDRDVIERFGPTIEAAIAGKLDAWADSPRSRLALVILLDQLTRNMYRNQARMYAGDARAQELALQSFDGDGAAAKLELMERVFLAMPLLHAENLSMQRRAGEIGAELRRDAPPLYQRLLEMHEEQTRKYTAVIERFGRFPHRNELLGRESTAEEIEFLRDWADRAPPAGAPRTR